MRAADESISLQEAKQLALRVLAAREVRRNLDAIRARGSEPIYVPADVSRDDETTAALGRVRDEHGPIQGVIHAAGVLRDTRLASMTREQFETVYHTKVTGLRNLLRATAEDPLRALCCFSSIAARVGNPSQLNYNVANEVLNKVCLLEKQRRGPDFVAKSIAWGAWDGGMVNAHVRKQFKELGVALIPPEAGAQAFAAELQSAPAGPVEVVLTGAVSERFLRGARDRLESSFLLRNDVCPFLKDHEILDTAVVPVTMAIELALKSSERLAGDRNGNGETVCLSGVRVLKGIRAPQFESSGDWITVDAGPNGGAGSALVSIHGGGERRSYEITRTQNGDAKPSPPEIPASAESWDWDVATIYRHRALLFHGPEFQVIDSLESIGDWGCSAVLERSDAPTGPTTEWATDLFVLDGGMQLGVLWVWKTYENHALPTKVGQIRFYRHGLMEGRLRCVLLARSHNQFSSSFDVWWLGDNDEVLVHAEDVQLTHVPASWIPKEIAGRPTAFYAEGAESGNPAPVD